MEPFLFLLLLILFSKAGTGEISLEIYCLKITEAPALRRRWLQEWETPMSTTNYQKHHARMAMYRPRISSPVRDGKTEGWPRISALRRRDTLVPKWWRLLSLWTAVLDDIFSNVCFSELRMLAVPT